MSAGLVLLHGWGMRAAIWENLDANLGPRNVHRPDLPGYGDAPAPTAYTLEAVVDALARDLPERVDLVGWSLGGTLALHWALTRPAQIRRLVLIATTPRFVAHESWPHGVSPATLRIFTTQLKRDADALMRRFCALQAEGEADADTVATRLYEARAQTDSTTLLASLGLLGETDLCDPVRRLEQPALVLHGAQDTVTPVSAARWLAAALPDARLHIDESGGHALPLTRAEDCARRITEFLHE